MKCLLKNCNNTIPVTRKRSAKYCSEECNYRARMQRSVERYAILKSFTDEIKRCESILAYFYELINKLKKHVTVGDLDTYKFNSELTIREHKADRNRICKVIGKYAYYIETNQIVTIWKLH